MRYELLSRGRHNFYEYSWLRDLVESEISFKEAMSALLAYSLIESHERIESYSIHPVVHDWCTESISRAQVDNISLAFTIVGSAVPSQSEPEYWLTQRRLLPHADRCVRYLQELDTPDRIGYSGSNDAFHNLGDLYADQGKMAEAEKMYERALEGYEKAWDPEHTSTLSTVNNLGTLYRNQGKMAEAERMYERALEGFEKVEDLNHPIIKQIIQNLSSIQDAKARAEIKGAQQDVQTALSPNCSKRIREATLHEPSSPRKKANCQGLRERSGKLRFYS